jgi:transcriptional regulator with XRE-family HTH domain
MAYRRTRADLLTRDEFGAVLRSWRGRRNRSQLDLAGAAGVSQRHISFLETGRSRPSREMVMHLGIVLDLPLRERNAMLIAAGFAPVFPERSIDDPEMADIRRALESMLHAHDPFPAYVIDRHWNLVMANPAAAIFIASLPPQSHALAGNLARLVFHPDGLRQGAENWAEAAAATLRRLEREAEDSPGDRELAALLDEVRGYPDVPSDRELSRVPTAHEILVPLRIRRDDRLLSFFTTIATLASPSDITLQELRLETLLPADAATEAELRAVRDSAR